MILELLTLVWLASGPGFAADPADPAADPAADPSADPAPAEGEPPVEPPPVEDPLSRYRTPFGVLMDRAVGSASMPVEYNWRRTTAQVGAMGDFLFELNNFNSARAGAMGRFPSGGLIYEVALSRVWVWDTPSSRLLAYTPYRQPGRPERFEADFNVGIPIAEGVVTARTRFVPTVQMVLNAYAGIHYCFYPFSFDGMKAREVAGALLSPALSEDEINQMEDRRLSAMEVDPQRYTVMAGIGNDLYLKQGVFLSPRVMFNVPLLAVATESDLLFWGQFSLAAGVAF